MKPPLRVGGFLSVREFKNALAADAAGLAARQAEREATRKERNIKMKKYKDPAYKKRAFEFDRGRRTADVPLGASGYVKAQTTSKPNKTG